MFYLKAAINIERAEIVAEFDITNDVEINKENWNAFWIIYNLLQLFTLNRRNKETDILSDITSELILDDILSQFNTPFHLLIEKLYKSGKLQTEKDEIALYSLTDSNGDILAEAEFIIQAEKFVINPFSTEDESVFIKQGYKVVDEDKLKEIEL